MSGHTPGPWRHATKGNFGNLIEAQSGRSHSELDDGWRAVATVQDCCASNLYDEQEANRAANIALVAAAPDMLDALTEINRLVHQTTPRTEPSLHHWQRDFDAIRKICASAIAKATGGQ